MEQHLSNVLPFLAARLNTPIAELSAQPVKDVAHLFGEHAILFLDEVAQNPYRPTPFSEAERTAFPAIKEAAKLVGIHHG